MAFRLYQNIFNLPSSANVEKELADTTFLNLNGFIYRENKQIQQQIRTMMETRMNLDNVKITKMYNLRMSNLKDFLEFHMEFDGAGVNKESMMFRITVMSFNKKILRIWITSIDEFSKYLISHQNME